MREEVQAVLTILMVLLAFLGGCDAPTEQNTPSPGAGREEGDREIWHAFDLAAEDPKQFIEALDKHSPADLGALRYEPPEDFLAWQVTRAGRPISLSTSVVRPRFEAIEARLAETPEHASATWRRLDALFAGIMASLAGETAPDGSATSAFLGVTSYRGWIHQRLVAIEGDDGPAAARLARLEAINRARMPIDASEVP